MYQPLLNPDTSTVKAKASSFGGMLVLHSVCFSRYSSDGQGTVSQERPQNESSSRYECSGQMESVIPVRDSLSAITRPVNW